MKSKEEIIQREFHKRYRDTKERNPIGYEQFREWFTHISKVKNWAKRIEKKSSGSSTKRPFWKW